MRLACKGRWQPSILPLGCVTTAYRLFGHSTRELLQAEQGILIEHLLGGKEISCERFGLGCKEMHSEKEKSQDLPNTHQKCCMLRMLV